MSRRRPLRAAVAAAALGLAAASPPVPCAIGEAEGTPAGTCLDAFEACGASMSDKLVWIQPNWPTGLPYQAWCGADGYTLAMKIDGTTNTFGYESPLWESAALLNGDPAAYTTVANAKLEPFVNHPVDAVKLEFTTPQGAGAPVELTQASTAASLRSLFQGGFVATTGTRQAWLDSFVGGAINQDNCNQQGFNNIVDANSLGQNLLLQYRLGILWNEENDCVLPDTGVGIGGRMRWNDRNSDGGAFNFAPCCGLKNALGLNFGTSYTETIQTSAFPDQSGGSYVNATALVWVKGRGLATNTATATASHTATPTATASATSTCGAAPVQGSEEVRSPSLIWTPPFGAPQSNTLFGSGRTGTIGAELVGLRISSGGSGATFSVTASGLTTVDIADGVRSSSPHAWKLVDLVPASPGGATGELVYFYVNSPDARLRVTDGTEPGTCHVTLTGPTVDVTLGATLGKQLVFESPRSASFKGSVFLAQAPTVGAATCPAALTLSNATALYGVVEGIQTPINCGGYVYYVAQDAADPDHTLRLWRTTALAVAPTMVAGLEVSTGAGTLTCFNGVTVAVAARTGQGAYTVFGRSASSGPWAPFEIPSATYAVPRWLTPVDGFGLCWSATVSTASGRRVMCAPLATSISGSGALPAAAILAGDVQLSSNDQASSVRAAFGAVFFQCSTLGSAGPFYACSYTPSTPAVPPVVYNCAPPAAPFSNFVPVTTLTGANVVVYPVMSNPLVIPQDTEKTLFAIKV